MNPNGSMPHWAPTGKISYRVTPLTKKVVLTVEMEKQEPPAKYNRIWVDASPNHFVECPELSDKLREMTKK